LPITTPFDLEDTIEFIKNDKMPDKVKSYDSGQIRLNNMSVGRSGLTGVMRLFLLNYDYIISTGIQGMFILTEKGIKAKQIGGHRKYIDHIADLEKTDLELKKTTIDVNQSLIKVNGSLEVTNESIKTTNDFTRATNTISVLVAIITGIFIGIQVFRECGKTEPPIDKVLELNNQLLNKLLQDQKKQNSTISAMKKNNKQK
jgi:uncharacterized protein YneF (UPF0154 family)